MPIEPAEQPVIDAVAEGFPAAVGALGRLVRIPSVAFPGFPREPLQASAEAVAQLLRDTGAFTAVEVASAEYATDEGTATGSPAVIARRPAAPGRPTVLLYAHHDVQPAGREELWSTPPFEPTLVGERLFGRGASDDKAGVVTHVAAITAALQALGDDLGVGIAVFVEGEEEAGSRSFDDFLAAHHDVLAADVIVVADSDNVSTTVPALTSSLRGNATATLEIATLDHASHSGMYGGAAPDAVLAAIRLLDTLWDEDGAVAVAGLLQAAPPEGGPAGPSLEDLAVDAALLPGVTPIGRGTVADRLWYGPSITVTGIDVTDVLNASNTLLPSVRARISCRIAPGQAAAEAFAAIERHLRDHLPFGAHLTIADVDLGEPFLVDQSGWAAAAARSALADGWGAEPELTGIGGSIPFISTLTERFPGAQILITGVEDPDTRAHSPNESQDLGVLRRSITAEALLLARLSRRSDR
ncbi:M20/M25/M40 family metallo-hydrolase [Amnibacterium setariae]|uniref:M20/M25/M40 family metallo-hydrolase n=1 Tax=Amnibacterium setariae TaxID=2306585 RepID=A0A3A1TYD3_9MICO|nr:M20/M25/M40 family metallo-hydrolase [Amnibacterium setariae]RIX27675.1 M20/M25/M40 family metallo-hydrolase [Amnibacterium setariae]